MLDTIDLADPTGRLARRRSVKQEMGRRLALLNRAEIEQRAADALERRKTESSDKCEAACAPLRERLAEVESAIGIAIVEGKTIPVGLQSEQDEITQEIGKHTEALSREITVIDKSLLPKKRKEIRDLRSEAAGVTVLENQLCKQPLVNPNLSLKSYSLDQAVHFAGLRVESASAQVEQWEGHLKALRNEGRGKRFDPFGRPAANEPDSYDRSQIDLFESRLERWKFELNEARTAASAIAAERAAIRQQMLDE